MTGNSFTGGSTLGLNGAFNQSQQPNGVQQVSQTSSTDPSGQQNNHNSETQNSAGKELAAQQSLPTNQVIQNPSGLYNMTHMGMTSQQHYAPNLYFGPQFQTWTNQQGRTDSPASYGEMSRFQVGQFGGYVAPNTYNGSGFNNWSNLNSGSSTQSANGGWTYSTWP